MLKQNPIVSLAPKRVILITAVAGTVIMGDSMLYNVLPSRVDAFGISVGMVGVLLSANRVIRLVSNPLAAWMFQRFGMTIPLFASILVAVGTTVAYGTVSIFGILLLARLLWGITFSVFRLSGYLVVLDESADTSRGRLMGTFSSGMRIGSIIGVLLGGLLFDLTGRTVSFLIIAAFGALGLPAAWGLTRRPRTASHIITSADTDKEPVPTNIVSQQIDRSKAVGLSERVWDFFVSNSFVGNSSKRRLVLAVCVTFFSFQLVMNGVLVSSLGFYLNQNLGSGVAVSGILIGIATLNGVLISTRWIAGLAAPYFGYLGDHYGRGRILAIALPVCVIALLLLASPISFWLIVIWLPISFIAVAASTVSLDSIVGGLAPVNGRAEVMSRYATWQDTGSAIGPLLAFSVLGFASLSVVYLAGAALVSVSLGWFLFALNRYSKSESTKTTANLTINNDQES